MAWGDHGFAAAVAAMTFLAAAAGGAAPARAASEAPHSAVASIDVTKTDAGLLVKGKVLALEAGHFEATMKIAKSGKSGSMNTTQGGKLDLGAGETGTVAQVGLSFTVGDKLDIVLDVMGGGAVVSECRLRIP